MKGVGCSTQVGRSPLRDAPPRYQMSALGRFQSAIQLSTAHIPTFFSRDRARGLVAIGPMLSSEECICISQPERQDVVHFAISMSREIKIQNMTRQFTHFCISHMHNSNVFSWDGSRKSSLGFGRRKGVDAAFQCGVMAGFTSSRDWYGKQSWSLETSL